MATYHNHHFRRITRIAETGRYVKTKLGIVFYHLVATFDEQPALVLDDVLLQDGRQVRIEFLTWKMHMWGINRSSAYLRYKQDSPTFSMSTGWP